MHAAPRGALHRLAGLLVHEGFLLLPVLGVGAFLFPRVMGGFSGEPIGSFWSAGADRSGGSGLPHVGGSDEGI